MRWGVDLDLFSPAADRAAAKRELDLPDAPVVLSARGLAPVYNPDVVLSAFELLRERLPDALLVLKHLGPGEPELAGRPLPPGVRIVGNVPYEQLPAYFRAADVCLSIPRSDSSPRSVWEAMACGCPCVLSDLPWTSELIEDARHAVLVSPEPQATAAGLERVLTDRSLADRLRIEGRALVERHHDRNVEMDRLSELYATVAAGRQP
jgi:glycosyltransferase involved in cell wall biosynthesis